MGSPVVLGGDGTALLPNPRVSMPHGPQVPGWHLNPEQGAVHGCSSCSRGCGRPWQPQGQHAGMGAQEGPWRDRHVAPGLGALRDERTPSPAHTRTPSPGNSLPAGWLGKDRPWGAHSYLPCFAPLMTWWPAPSLSSQWGKGRASEMEWGR